MLQSQEKTVGISWKLTELCRIPWETFQNRLFYESFSIILLTISDQTIEFLIFKQTQFFRLLKILQYQVKSVPLSWKLTELSRFPRESFFPVFWIIADDSAIHSRPNYQLGNFQSKSIFQMALNATVSRVKCAMI